MSLGYHPLAGGQLPGYRPGPRKPLPPDEADSAAQGLLGYSTSLLQTGLHVLDTPAALVRGAIGSVVGARPAPGERTSGRDITDALGWTDSYSRSFASGVGSFLADTALDPLSYLSFGTAGAATKAGKALAKTGATAGWSRRQLLRGFDGVESSLRAAGHSADDIAHMVDQGRKIATPEMEQVVANAGGKLAAGQPLAGLVGFSPIPFRGPSHVFGTGGPLARRIAGGLDAAGDKLRFGNALGRWAGAMLDPTVREATGAATQRAMSRYGTPAYQAAQAQGRADVAHVIGRIHGAADAGFPEGDVLRAGRMLGEGALPRGLPAGLEPLARPIGDAMGSAERRQLAEAMDLGLPLRDANDAYSAYIPRQGIDLKAARDRAVGGSTMDPGRGIGPLDPRNIVPTMTSADFHRDDLWRGIPGGTERINDWVRQYAGNPNNLAPAALARQLRRDMLTEHMATAGPLLPFRLPGSC